MSFEPPSPGQRIKEPDPVWKLPVPYQKLQFPAQARDFSVGGESGVAKDQNKPPLARDGSRRAALAYDTTLRCFLLINPGPQ